MRARYHACRSSGVDHDDTRWRHRTDGTEQRWQGRACKIYTRRADGEWKMIAHTGLLKYGN